MKHLKQLQQQLKESLPKEGITPVLKSLRELLPENSPKYNLLLQLDSEYRELKLRTLEGVLSQDEIKLVNNQIRKRLLEFIDGLEAADFDSQTKRSRFANEQKIRKGHVLYQIPHTMQLWEESRCLVRIAFDKAMLVEDLDLDEDTKVKMDVRVSDYMKVEVIDPAAEPTFEIRSTSEAVQFVDEDDFTEWRYYVKPLRPGKHLLELKVTIMLMIDGEARVRERTLEESVVIVAEPVEEPVEATFKRLDEQLTLPCTVEQIAPSASAFRLPKGLRTLALGLIGLLVVSATTWAVAPPEERNWIVTRYLENTEAAYQEYIDQFPESTHQEIATFRKAKVQKVQNPEAYREYLNAYPDGKYVEPATWEIAKLTKEPENYVAYLERFPSTPKAAIAQKELQQLEPKVWQAIQSQPDLLALDRYLRLYPQGTYQEAVRGLLEDSIVWKSPLPQDSTSINLDALQERLWQQVQPLNSVPALKQFLQRFPEGPYRKEARNQLDALIRGASQSSPGASEQPNTVSSDESTKVPVTGASRSGDNHITTTPADPEVSQLPDSDQDGIADVDDQCPDVAGTIELKGCPSPTSTPKAETPKMLLIKGGTFEMGDRIDKNALAHTVTVSNFYIGATEVTFKEYDDFCTDTGRNLKNDEGWGRGRRPVINVSWLDAIVYANWLSLQNGYTPVYSMQGNTIKADWSANGYRLPTEAEWEFAARGRGGKDQWAGTSLASDLASYANGADDKDGYERTAPAGSFQPNSLGLYDMSGNVWEWCWDWYSSDYYTKTANTQDPKGSESGSYRVRRGGSWSNSAAFLRCTNRNLFRPDSRAPIGGFRLARSGG